MSCVLVVAGCATGGGGGPDDITPGGPIVDSRAELEGRTFLSVEVTGATLVPDTRIQLIFKDDTVAASAGCNGMGGAYGWDGTTLTVEDLAMTEMGCDPSRHAQDTWLADLLTSGPRLALDGDDLVVSGTTIEVKMRDREVVQPDLPLAGTRWRVDTILTGESASSVPGDAESTFVFEQGPDGTVSSVTGTSGCNQFGGPVEEVAGSLNFRDVVITRMACSGAAGALERAVLPLFDGRPVKYVIDADRLSLVNPDGNGVQLRAS
jgi:heat shock protein HslJ